MNYDLQMKYYTPNEVMIALKEFIGNKTEANLKDTCKRIGISHVTYYSIKYGKKRRLRDETIKKLIKAGVLK